MPMRNVCVYCGSSAGARAAYAAHARAFGTALARRGLGLVYGGASVGIMGALADAVLGNGGRVVGVIPRPLVARELAHRGLSELRITESMHERKQVMTELADAFVALPGGAGTLDELFEAWTWGQLGLHRKPCGLLNAEHYFEALIGFIDHATVEGFVQARHRAMLLVASDPEDLLDRLDRYEAPELQPWLRAEQS
jgi:uncharacterized protein (TIGR00730 family)